MSAPSDYHPRYAALVAHRDAWLPRLAAMDPAELAGLEAALSDHRRRVLATK